jgi:ribonuclease HI
LAECQNRKPKKSNRKSKQINQKDREITGLFVVPDPKNKYNILDMKKEARSLVINTDGGSRNNPGPAGIGFVIYDDQGNILETYKEYIGEATNNIAEYQALIRALKHAHEYHPEEIVCRLDSELVVKQVRGEYKAKDEKMKELLNQVREMSFFRPVSFVHVRREQNKLADKLVNEALDEAGF